MKFTLFALSTLTASLAAAYPITGDDVKCRSGPGTIYAAKKVLKKGTDVTITCQTEGTNISGNTIWDKISDGCYVSDYYVKTGSNGYVKPKCGGGCSAPSSNQATVDLIGEFEGFVPHIYKDAAGYPTVGYGHLCSNSKCTDVKYPIPLSKANGKKLLADDMRKFEKCIAKMVSSKVALNKNQFGALVSWSFNVGCGAAEGSQLIKRLNKGEKPNTVVSGELPKWVYAGKRKLPGLVRRRNAEIALAKKATSEKALPVKC
ncbi:lysozyme-like domain-containing protein [Dactylonectria estremocensis]|uniref:Lysozyme-like domain-containing protein n=1 Tax=Dactylonectria estremocensis TaxID=1079267 RepID=A0A9P9D0V7_9HYPO|nr:lysozyme-like domain-containing protein [Dactylonectria estremocensis]